MYTIKLFIRIEHINYLAFILAIIQINNRILSFLTNRETEKQSEKKTFLGIITISVIVVDDVDVVVYMRTDWIFFVYFSKQIFEKKTNHNRKSHYAHHWCAVYQYQSRSLWEPWLKSRLFMRRQFRERKDVLSIVLNQQVYATIIFCQLNWLNWMAVNKFVFHFGMMWCRLWVRDFSFWLIHIRMYYCKQRDYIFWIH